MVRKVLTYLPDMMVFVEAFFCFIVPFGISKFFNWISSLERV
jgi:hypothetical protein